MGSRLDQPAHGDRAAADRATVVASARTFAGRCHEHQRRESDGAPFIEHPLEVAGLLREAGCSEVVVAAGLLHDVVENTAVGVPELRARFGADVALLVQVLSEDPSIRCYHRRKQALREQVRHAGSDAAAVFAADKIAKLRELGERIERDRAGFQPTALARPERMRLEPREQMRLEHYHESLRMLRQIAPGHPLVTRLAAELDRCLVALRHGRAQGRGRMTRL